VTSPAADAGDRPAATVSGRAATMTVLVMGLGYSITAADPTILSANISEVRAGLHLSPSTASFLASLATLTLAAAVLGAGALGDLYGMKRMFTVGLLGAVGFGLLAAAAPSGAVLIAARAGAGVAFAFLLGLSLALINAVFPPQRRAGAIAAYLAAGFALTTPMPAIGSLDDDRHRSGHRAVDRRCRHTHLRPQRPSPHPCPCGVCPRPCLLTLTALGVPFGLQDQQSGDGNIRHLGAEFPIPLIGVDDDTLGV
jgi:hypothetical protein